MPERPHDREEPMPDPSTPTPSILRLRRAGRAAAVLAAAVLAAGGFLPKAPDLPYALPLLWPEEQRAFLQDGPGLLMSREQLDQLVDLDAVGRQQAIDRFLADPLPDTPENELAEGVAERRALVRHELLTYLDARAQLLFLHGPPWRREIVACSETYKPMELWTYDLGEGTIRTLILYQPKPRTGYQLWLPLDSKRVLYNEEMEYWLEQWAELGNRIRGRRFDRQICSRSAEIDYITGIDGLFGFRPNRPTNDEMAVFLEPPHDLAAWARKAAVPIEGLPETLLVDEDQARDLAKARRNMPAGGGVTPQPQEESPDVDSARPAITPSPLVPWTRPPEAQAEFALFFPEREGPRMTTRVLVTIPPETPLQPFVEGEKKELRFVLEGQLEHDGQSFESFRVRYLLPPPPEGVPVALAADRLLRPGQEFLVRLRITEEISGLEMAYNRGFVVPSDPTPFDEQPQVAAEIVTGLTEELKRSRVEGYDSLILVPPETDVVFGLWRAEALVTGQRIQEVRYFLDGALQFTRRRPPFTAELRLATYPKEQVVRAEGYDAAGELVASDEVVLNQPRGELRVRILEPLRGRAVVAGDVTVKAEIVVPEEARVAKVDFLLNDELKATVTKPPWEAVIDVPPTGALTYITVAAELEDGLRAEDVRFLNAPNYMEEVDVNLVELYTTVTDKTGRLIRDLAESDFTVLEDGQPQTISKFELVENLPLTLGIALDTSGSMFESMREAQLAAVGFLENIITPRDRCFALAFADRPALLMPRTSDVGAVAQRLESTLANGATSLHDAIVTSLYYYRGIRGRRALVILSDGEDTSSTIEFKDALEYAKRSGVAVYAIGLRIGRTQVGVRRKLDALAEETGGRALYIHEAAELQGAYAEIERELRSQYLVAYSSDQSGEPGQYHEIEVEVKDGKLKARTIRGYYS